jgi:hypothetical protein
MKESQAIINDIFTCSICGSQYNRLLYKINCEKSHKILYVPLHRKDIDRIMQFIYKYYNEDEDILPKNMMNIFHKIMGLKENIDMLPAELDTFDEEGKE